jgi:hypothetical protein
MKKNIIFFAVFFVMVQACNLNSGNKTANTKLIDKKRCSFKLPGNLSLQNIDTSKFSIEGYFKIAPAVESGMMQIFVFNEPSDVNEKVNLQEKALNTPNIFTASAITPVKHWGKYDGSGIAMPGIYYGGIIKGKITLFCYSNDKSSFLIIRQDIGSHESVKADFDVIENSFILK